MASTIAEQVGVTQVEPGKDEFTSTSLPIRMGNALPIAYGGCAMSVAVHAAARTVPETHKLYSVVGHFHGPATLDRPFKCSVTRTRDTRSFATRRVRVSQLQPQRQQKPNTTTTTTIATDTSSSSDQSPPLQERVCLELIADFHAVEEALITFSPPPNRPYGPPDASPTSRELQEELRRAGRIDGHGNGDGPSNEFTTMFDAMDRLFEMRFCREGMSGQNMGWARHVPTDQDALPLTARSSAEWYRVRPDADPKPRTHAENCAAVAFLMDGGLAFLPLVHTHRGFADAGATSSLDFALRFFTPDVDMSRWHLKDRAAHAAGAGRSYAEGRLFDDQGRLVASMTQQGILRPPPKRKDKAVL
ncbi:hypothetical protein MGN70_004623 [Eutypa lata]|nr:hypothetical protein MGN70_004623 [Eutypa lata]